MNTSKTISKRQFLDQVYFNYLLDCINLDGKDFNPEPTEPAERIKAVCEAFKSEYCYPDNLRRYKTYQEVMRNWLMGLPSILGVDYENYRIIELCKEWGVLKQDAGDRAEDKILANWFNFMAHKFFQICKHYKVDIYKILAA